MRLGVARPHRSRVTHAITAAVVRGIFLLFIAAGLLYVSFGHAVAHSPMAPPHLAAPSGSVVPDQVEGFCLSCHAGKKLALTLGNGDKIDLDLETPRYLASIHGGKLTCTDCHIGYGAPPHVLVVSADRRQYSNDRYEICKRCHFAEFTRTLDSIHYRAHEAGNPEAANCVDCHGAHYVSRPGESRVATSQSCSQCHQSVYEAYRSSVHGDALVQENNQDVPLCTDCHGVHSIQDPRTATFRLNIPEMCGKCHIDETLMSRYGLSTAVLQTYLRDFHGVTTGLLQEQSPLIWSREAVCTDCHGIHDIAKTNDPQSQVIRENMVKTCRECHPDATENFPAAWLGHYEPSWSRAPLVFLVDIFYRIFIPFVAGGMVLHLLVDLWRILSGRR